VYQWENFESGKIASNSSPIGAGFENRVRVIEYSSIPNPPQGLYTPDGAKELGKYGLAIQVDAENPVLGLGVGVILRREELGASGRALVQADFFIPDSSHPVPSLGVLAMEPMTADQREPELFYRFGCTKNRDYYFSLVQKDAAEAPLYKFDRDFRARIPRSGWHRYQIVFEGPTKVRCFVDGKEAPFSPVEDTRLGRFQVGILAAERDTAYTCYADNLSIQWTPEDAPLPDSPYAASWGDAPVTLQAQGTVLSAQRAGAAPVQWQDPEAAWQRSQATKAPLLVYFYAPRVPNTQHLNRLIDSTPAAQAFLSRHALAAIDVNQLQGGTYAKQFGVFRVPTLILLDGSGQEVRRVIYDQTQTWPMVEAALTAPAAAPRQPSWPPSP